ncbi:MAG: hypothetical protein IJ213_09840 [Bacteroidales bacterium]|nr:hypothetical protein [Bacteroidales bacterium]
MRKFCFFVFLFVSSLSFSQIDNLLNDLEEDNIDNEAKQQLFETIQINDNNLFNINNLSPEEMTLLGLNNFQQFCLQNYIQQTGQLFSLNELRFVNGFDEKTIASISPFLYVEPYVRKRPLRLDSIFYNAKQSLRFQYSENLHRPYGYRRKDNKGYLGEKFASSFRYYLKYYDRLEFSFVADKDAGEPLYYKNKTYGFDHYNISLTIRDINKHLKQMTIGDYRLSIAEGLAMKQTFDISYLSDYGIKNKRNKISPFRSTTEYDYNKGLALQMNFGRWDIITFFSYNSLDYNGSTIQQTGYHRTQTEINNKDTLFQTLIGANLQYIYKNFSIGATFLTYHFSDSISPRVSSYPYMKYYFSGTNNNIISVNTAYSIKRLHFFAELSKSANNAFAYIVGSQYDIGYKSHLSVSYRDYGKDYQNFFANAIGIHDNNQNERGIYIDYSQMINNKFNYFIGADFFYFPFISYRANKSVYGQKTKLQLNYKPNDKNLFDFCARLTNRQYNTTLQNQTILPKNNITTQFHLRYKHAFTQTLSLNFRTGYSHSFTYKDNDNYGLYSYIEAIYKDKNFPLKLNVRYTYFHSADYDNHFSIYEYTLPLNFSTANLNGEGNRVYAIVSYSLYNVQLSLKYVFTRYSHTSQISNGNDKILSNNTQYLYAQIFYSF